MKELLDYLDSVRKRYSPEIFEETPVDFRTFCEHFLKQPMPELKYQIAEHILGKDPTKWNTEYQEIYLQAGKGAGKNFFVARLLVYIGYWLLCLNNPQKFFGLAEGTAIDLANVSVNANQAKEVFFREFTSVILRTTNPLTGNNWFAEHGMDLREEMDIQTSKVIFSLPHRKNIVAYSLNAERYTGEGKNLLVVIFDEVGAFRFSKAADLYDSLESTGRSRFGKFRKMVLISYKYHDNDFMQYIWKEAQKKQRKKGHHCGILLLGPYATWELNPNTRKEDYADEYERNPQRAQRIYECKGSSSEEKYFNPDLVEKAINTKRINPVKNFVLTVRDLKKLQFHDWFRGNWVYEIEIEKNPEVKNSLISLHSNARYHVHVDLAKGQEGGDCAGFALAHKITPPEGPYQIYIDLMLQIKGRNGRPINFEEIRQFIYYLTTNLGFNIKLISLDGYQSEDFIQIVKSKGYEAKLVSVDRNIAPYETFQDLLYQQRINFYNHPVLIRELKELEEINGKVDHPEKSMLRDLQEGDDRGSKDVADAVVGVTYTLVTHKNSPSVSFTFVSDYDEDDE